MHTLTIELIYIASSMTSFMIHVAHCLFHQPVFIDRQYVGQYDKERNHGLNLWLIPSRYARLTCAWVG